MRLQVEATQFCTLMFIKQDFYKESLMKIFIIQSVIKFKWNRYKQGLYWLIQQAQKELEERLQKDKDWKKLNISMQASELLEM